MAREAGVAGATWRDDAGNESPEWSTGAVWVDVDGDGWLDLFATNYVRWSPGTDIYTSLASAVWRISRPPNWQRS